MRQRRQMARRQMTVPILYPMQVLDEQVPAHGLVPQ
jgi:hypothetical protein